MPDMPAAEVFFHSTDPQTSPWPYGVEAGGRTRVTHRDGVVSRHYHQHTLILTLSGRGRITLGEHAFSSEPGDLVWLDTGRHYAHGADRQATWSYLWLGLSGFGLDRLHTQIGLWQNPIVADMANLEPRFEVTLESLAQQGPMTGADTSAQIAMILAKVFAKRHEALAAGEADPIAAVMRHLRADIAQNWDIAAMAQIAGLSPSQLFRRFKQATGTTPGTWLRDERMHLARHLLTATSDKVATIALRCGYADPFHFSRDFKRLTSDSPRDFRAGVRAR